MLMTVEQPSIITEPIVLGELPDPSPGTTEYRVAEQRAATGTSIGAMPWLPQLPDAWATETYEQLDALERQLIAPSRVSGQYLEGTATTANEVLVVGTQPAGVLFTAEHATKPVRFAFGKIGACDVGTGSLAALLALNHGLGFIANGRQDSNAALNPEHPVKQAMQTHLSTAAGFVAVHGMGGGKFVRPHDASEVQISIGLGQNPTPPETLVLAERLVAAAHELGLYAIIGNRQQYYVQRWGSTNLQRQDDGSTYRHELAAYRPTTTVNHVRQQAAILDRQLPALQIELTSLLRLPLADKRYGRDRRSEIMGVALGYRFMEQVALLLSREVALTAS